MSLGHICPVVLLFVGVLCDSSQLTAALWNTVREAGRQQQYLMVFGGYPNGTNEVELVAVEDDVIVPECLKGDLSGHQPYFFDIILRLRIHRGLALPILPIFSSA